MATKAADTGREFQPLAPDSLYLASIDSELALKLLLFTEAFKVKRTCGRLSLTASILAYVDVYQI